MLVPEDDPHLPVGVETVVLQRLPDQHDVLSAYARLREESSDGGLLADVYLVDDKGFSVAQLEGVSLARAGGGLFRTGAGRIGLDNPQGIYREAWMAMPIPEDKSEPGKTPLWYVLTDDQRLGTGLADVLARRGGKSEFIDASGERKANPADALADKLGSGRSESGEPVGVVGIWTGKGGRQSNRHTGPALESFGLVRALLDSPDLSYRLRLITAGAQSVVDGDRAKPELGTIWGCGRVAAQEHPELNCAMIDVPAGTDGIDLEHLAGIVAADKLPGEIAIRKTELYTRRLVPMNLANTKAKQVYASSYLNTSYRLTQSTPGSIDDLHFVSDRSVNQRRMRSSSACRQPR